MPAALLRTSLLLLLWLVLGFSPAAASHLVGGELTYRYLNSTGPAIAPHRYQITARIYFNMEPGSSAPNGSPNIRINVSSKAANGSLLAAPMVLLGSATEVTAPNVPGCSIRNPRVTLGLYTTTVELPLVSEGYLATFSAAARNAGITNINNSQNESMTLSVDMTPPSRPNSSPTFTNNALAAICLGDTSVVLNNANDADGDRLSYSLGTPAGGSVFQPVSYAPGYSETDPFGTPGFAAVDARTGLARYLCATQGTFLLAIDVKEYRTINGQEVLLGTLRRDIQITVRTCGNGTNLPPIFTPATTAQRNFTIEEGQVVSFTVAATDPDNHPLNMNLNSVLLDGPGTIDASVNGQSGTGSAGVAGNVSLSGTGAVTGAFRLQAGCGLARPAPYDVVVTVADAVCGSKTIGTVFRITVTRQAPLTRVHGDSVLCAQSVARYVAGGPAFGSYRWTVHGGRVLGQATGRTVQVEWMGASANQVTVRGITPLGCLTDSVSQVVDVEGGPAITGPSAYCRTASTGLRYTVAGAPAAYQWSIADGSIVSGQGTNTVLVDIPEGATSTLQVANPARTTYVSTLSIKLDDTCLYFYNIITPNGDGQNDFFVIENVERHANTALAVYNRWGRQVYQSSDYHNTFGSEGTTPGVYYYRCQLADGTAYKGWFEVVR